jgi:hypothetical protein
MTLLWCADTELVTGYVTNEACKTACASSMTEHWST